MALFALLGCLSAGHAQASLPSAPAASRAGRPASAPLGPHTLVTIEPVSSIPAAAQDLVPLHDEILQMQATIKSDIETVRPAWWERLVPAGIGFAGVFVGGLLGWFQQGRQLKLSAQLQQEQLREYERTSRAKAAYESLSKVIEYQTKQLNEFYSPLRLMLLRSGGVRRQLTDQLQAKAPERFNYVTETDGRDHLFVIEPDGTPKRFRLIEHMHELVTSHVEFMPLVQEILNIGIAMSELVNAKGGMAIATSDRLTVLLGRYLAHLSILRDVATKAVDAPELLDKLRYNLAYPVELDGALDEDMATLTSQIEAWKELSQQMWHEATNMTAAEVAELAATA